MYGYVSIYGCVAVGGVKGEDPIYDERGLRVPQKHGQRHVRSGSTPALMEGGGVTRQGAKFVSVCEYIIVCCCVGWLLWILYNDIHSFWRCH